MSQEKLAHYSLSEKIGEGGMGEVYRARDTKLGRDVALKFLPESLAHDSERLARFEREAKLLASLNHPHIASIHGFEQVNGRRFLVLEMIEGEDLAERIRRAALPVDEALAIARQITDALEAAHEEGVIHRDLKPSNIKVTPEGRVKVLDFGLAKAWEPDASSTDLSHSPTVMATSPTVQGVILGTAAYMSPEQARGKPVDRRADIFGFGCVLFEMLAGKQVFGGETVSDTLASVLKTEPDWNALPPDTPPAIQRLLRRCLEKDPAWRLRDIGEARIVIDRVMRGEVEEDVRALASDAAPVGATGRGGRVAWGIAGVSVLLAAVMAFLYMTREVPEVAVLRASLLPPDRVRFSLRGIHPGPVEISPDGSKIVYTGRAAGGASLLYVRDLDQIEARALPGTENAGYPFWSPDSRSVGFFADGKLKRIDVTGGPPLTLCDAPVGKGGTWNAAGTIVFSPSYNSPLHRVADIGGPSAPVTALRQDRTENSHRFPQFLPDGDHFIYYVRVGGEGSGIWYASLSGGEEGQLLPTTSNGQYASGYLLFMREATLMGRPFDPVRLEFTGDPVPVADPIRYIPGAMRGIFSASAGGNLVYQSGSTVPGSQLVWRALDGNELGRLGDIVQQDNHAISPDGSRVAFEIFDATGGTGDIWIYDVEREVRSRFTFDAANDVNAVWSPDGDRIAFASTRGGISQLYVKDVGGASTERLLVATAADAYPTDWTRDGKYVVYFMDDSTNTGDVWAAPVDGSGEPIRVVGSRYGEYDGVVSPDGNWVAYISDEAGRFEVYVTSFPEPGRKWQVSSGGGDDPRWSPDGNHMYYFSGNNAFHRVEVEYDATSFGIGATEALYGSNSMIFYRLAPDGKRMLVMEDADEGDVSPLTLVTSWTRELESRRR